MTEFTPGPWEAQPMTGRGAWVRGANGTWSALSCGDTDAEAEANARLIAAAPDLLNGCKALLGLLQLVRDRDDMPSAIREALTTSHRVEEAEAAVAKAAA